MKVLNQFPSCFHKNRTTRHAKGHTGDCPIRNVNIVLPSSRNRAPKCCIARPNCTDSILICPLTVGSVESLSCSKRPPMRYNIEANYKKERKQKFKNLKILFKKEGKVKEKRKIHNTQES